MSTALESLLDPISRTEFRERYYGKQPLLIRGHAGKFAGLFSWTGLNRLLNSSPFPHPEVEIRTIGKCDQRATALSVIEQCRAGASLAFYTIDHYDPNIGELARALQAEIGEPTNGALYVSQPARAALGKHFDQQDVFVLQLEGCKAWSVYEPSVQKPISYEAFTETLRDAPSHPGLECELAPGDVLYIPRGHWHQALAQRGLSVHLTLGMDSRTGIDFLKWLVEELRSDVRFRHELPLSFADEPAELRELSLREHVAELGEIVRSRFADAGTIQSFIRSYVLADRDVSRFKFPAQLLEAPATQMGVRWFSRPARQRFVLHDGPTEDLLALSVWGNVFQFQKSTRPLLEYIFSRTAFAYEDALAHAGGLTEEGIRSVLDPLLREGVLDAADGPSGGS